MYIIIAALAVGFIGGVVFSLGWIAYCRMTGKLIFEWVGKPDKKEKS